MIGTAIHAAMLLALVTQTTGQAAETSQWDTDITCTGGAVAAITSSAQTGYSTVTVNFASTDPMPEDVYLTNEAGTVVAYANTAGASSRTVALSYSASPQTLQARTCPSQASLMAPVRMWQAQYEDIRICCAINTTYALSSPFRPTLALDWAAQQVTVSATQKAPRLNFLKDSGGTVLRLDAGGPTGSYSQAGIPMAPGATSLTACAMLHGDDHNPICNSLSLMDHLGSDLETNGVTAAGTLETFATVTYTGTADEPLAEVDTGACSTYARLPSSGTPVVAFAFSGALTLDLNTLGTSTVTLYSCCGVAAAPPGGGALVCPSGALRSFVANVAAMKSQAALDIAAALDNEGAGTLSFSTSASSQCLGVYAIGAVVVNATGENCTCTAGETQYDEPQFVCGTLPPSTGAIYGPVEIAVLFSAPLSVAIVGVFCLLYLHVRQKSKAAKEAATYTSSTSGGQGGSTEMTEAEARKVEQAEAV